MPHAMPNQTRLGERKKYLVWALAEVIPLCISVGGFALVGFPVRIRGHCSELRHPERAAQRWCASVGTAPRLCASSA